MTRSPARTRSPTPRSESSRRNRIADPVTVKPVEFDWAGGGLLGVTRDESRRLDRAGDTQSSPALSIGRAEDARASESAQARRRGPRGRSGNRPPRGRRARATAAAERGTLCAALLPYFRVVFRSVCGAHEQPTGAGTESSIPADSPDLKMRRRIGSGAPTAGSAAGGGGRAALRRRQRCLMRAIVAIHHRHHHPTTTTIIFMMMMI